MHVGLLEDFARYLMNSQLTASDICKFLSLNTLSELDPTAVYLGEVTINGFIAPVGFFGVASEIMGEGGKTPLTVDVPQTEAVKNNQVVTVDRNEAFVKFPALKHCELLPDKWETYLACPILPYGVLAITFNSKPELDIGLESFLRAIGALAASYIQQSVAGNQRFNTRFTHKPTSTLGTLTERQLLIKDLIMKGHSNPSIAEEIGFSESLVRQETMAIYSILNISGRKELLEDKSE